MKITFKREERARGLARIGEGHRGYQINLDGERIGSISHANPKNEGLNNWSWFPSESDPWFVSIASHGSIPHYNGHSQRPRALFLNLEDAKRWAKDYIRKHLEVK